MYSNYQNEDGEWIMDGAAIRAEWAADDRDSYERDPWEQDDFYDNDDYDEGCTPETHGDDAEMHDGEWECSRCFQPCAAPEWDLPEDAHLDGMWEE